MRRAGLSQGGQSGGSASAGQVCSNRCWKSLVNREEGGLSLSHRYKKRRVHVTESSAGVVGVNMVLYLIISPSNH